MTLIVNITGVALILLTYWFFFMKKEKKAVVVEDAVEILVEGGYNPDVIQLEKGETAVLKFHRKDESSCLEEIVIPEFNVRQSLPLNKTTAITTTPQHAGEFQISCGMNMFHGKIIVVE